MTKKQFLAELKFCIYAQWLLFNFEAKVTPKLKLVAKWSFRK